MGVDFLRNKRMQHNKAWCDEALLKATDIFNGTPPSRARVFRGTLSGETPPQIGCELLLRRTDDGRVVASKDICLVASMDSPGQDLLAALNAHDGVMVGTVYECFEQLGC